MEVSAAGGGVESRRYPAPAPTITTMRTTAITVFLSILGSSYVSIFIRNEL
jgi:hypothetical protein